MSSRMMNMGHQKEPLRVDAQCDACLVFRGPRKLYIALFFFETVMQIFFSYCDSPNLSLWSLE